STLRIRAHPLVTLYVLRFAVIPAPFTSPMLLENLTWPEVKKIKWPRTIVLFPFGSFEQHGRHLPLTTDTDIVTGIGRRLEQKRPSKILCLPTLWPGHSTHHLFFPGTLSVS